MSWTPPCLTVNLKENMQGASTTEVMIIVGLEERFGLKLYLANFHLLDIFGDVLFRKMPTRNKPETLTQRRSYPVYELPSYEKATCLRSQVNCSRWRKVYRFQRKTCSLRFNSIVHFLLMDIPTSCLQKHLCTHFFVINLPGPVVNTHRPIGSMHGIFTYVYHVHTWILWVVADKNHPHFRHTGHIYTQKHLWTDMLLAPIEA